MFTVYVIFSAKLNRFYVGYTENLEKRLSEHNSGFSTYTSRANDWVLKYAEHYPDRQSAHNRELRIKGKKSRRYLEWLIAQ
ncbi:GIY-YIG nuclease family protein [Pelobium manganitolerans]|uniref:GIY-YIG nuclease family protein n=1 Tax=Pelobium manganitolerans TaxID=1842495 RepID=UPI000E752A3C